MTSFLDLGMLRQVDSDVVKRDTQRLLNEVGQIFGMLDRSRPYNGGDAGFVFVSYALDGLELMCLPDSYGASFYEYAAGGKSRGEPFFTAVEDRLTAVRFFA